jgi:hypothetical protein
MATTVERPYENTRQLFKLAEQAHQENFEFDRDLGEQAERLEEIAQLATEAAEFFRAIEAAVEGL